MRSFKLLLRCLSLLTVIDGVIIIEEQQQQQQQDQQQQVRDTSRPVTVNIQGFGKAVGRREGPCRPYLGAVRVKQTYSDEITSCYGNTCAAH